MQATGKILAVSRTAPGRRHDFRIRKEGNPCQKIQRSLKI